MKYYVLSKSDYAPAYYFSVDDKGAIDLHSVFSLPAGYGKSKNGDHFKPDIENHYIEFVKAEFTAADKSKWWGGHEMAENEFKVWSRQNSK